MPNPETGCVAVPRMEPVELGLGQSTARGVQASVICDAPQYESPVSVSGGGVREVVVSPKIARNLRWYIVLGRAIATEEQRVTTVDEAPLPQARGRPSLGHQPPRLARRPVGSGPAF